MSRGHFATCPFCRKERETTTGKVPKMRRHRRWDDRKREMVDCEGAGQVPALRTISVR